MGSGFSPSSVEKIIGHFNNHEKINKIKQEVGDDLSV